MNFHADFDDESSMDGEDYKVLSGFPRGEFQDIVSTVTTINSSKRLSKRTYVAILLLKFWSALSSKMLAVLFNMTKYQVNQNLKIKKTMKSINLSCNVFHTRLIYEIFFQIRRAIKSARTTIMNDFVPRNLGFQHITREDAHMSTCQKTSRPLVLLKIQKF